MFADMMHDTMRGVVYRALYAVNISDAVMAEQANAEILENGAAFVEAIDALKSLALPADSRAALDQIAAPLTGYIDI